MKDESVNTQIVETVKQTQEATLTGNVIKASGAGKALQSISQSSAIAVQDATDNPKKHQHHGDNGYGGGAV